MSTEHSERTFAAGLTRHSDCDCCEHAATEIARLTALIEKMFWLTLAFDELLDAERPRP